MKPHRSWFYGLSAVVTGASDGMGRIIAEKLITVFGCRVIGIARSADKLINVKNGLGDLSGRFEYIAADVSDAAFWKDLGARLIRENSAVDILINNAGVMPPFIPLRDTAEEVFERTTDVNYKAVYYSIKNLLPVLKKSRSAGIVNVSSAAALCPLAGTAVYSASKAAVKSLTEAFAAEEKHIYVSFVCPGFTKTNLFRDTGNFFESRLISFLSSSAEKAAGRILKGMEKRKKRIIIGSDAKTLRAFHKIAPSLSAPVVLAVMKASGMEIFDELRKKQ